MKRILLLLVCIAALSVSAGIRSAGIDATANPPVAGTPEHAALSFIRSLHAKDSDTCKSLMDKRAKVYYNQKLLKDKMRDAARWQLNEKYTYRKSESGDKSAIVTFKFTTKTGRSSFSCILKKIDGAWMITSP